MENDEKVVVNVELTGDKPNLVIQETTFKGKPMLNIVFIGGGMGSQFSFGIGKAKMILFALPEIKAFYDKYKTNLK